jgi:hypothetical protein
MFHVPLFDIFLPNALQHPKAKLIFQSGRCVKQLRFVNGNLEFFSACDVQFSWQIRLGHMAKALAGFKIFLTQLKSRPALSLSGWDQNFSTRWAMRKIFSAARVWR